jgi:hypothetical protein
MLLAVLVQSLMYIILLMEYLCGQDRDVSNEKEVQVRQRVFYCGACGKAYIGDLLLLKPSLDRCAGCVYVPITRSDDYEKIELCHGRYTEQQTDRYSENVLEVRDQVFV